MQRRRHAAIGEKAVDVIFGAAVRGAEEAADGEIVHDAAAIILLADSADQFQGVGQADRADSFQKIAFDGSAGRRHPFCHWTGAQGRVARRASAQHYDLAYRRGVKRGGLVGRRKVCGRKETKASATQKEGQGDIRGNVITYQLIAAA